MALTATFYYLNVLLVDRGGNTTNRRYQLIATDTSGDASTVFAAALDIIADLTTISLLKVKKYSVEKEFVEDALTLPTDAGAEVEAHALITAPIHGAPNKSATIDIPAPVPGIFVGTSGPAYNVVDTSDTDLLGYVNDFTPSGVGGLAYISDGESIDAVNLKGKRTHSHSLRG